MESTTQPEPESTVAPTTVEEQVNTESAPETTTVPETETTTSVPETTTTAPETTTTVPETTVATTVVGEDVVAAEPVEPVVVTAATTLAPEEEQQTVITTPTIVVVAQEFLDVPALRAPAGAEVSEIKTPTSSSTTTTTTTTVVERTPINCETGVDYQETFDHPNFHMAGWLWTHAVCRRLYMLIEKKINSNWTPKTNKEVKEVVRAIRACDQWLKSHHLHEDDIVWPWLAALKPETKDILDGAMTEQHHGWEDLSKELQDTLTELDTDNTLTADSDTFAPLLARLQDVHYRIVVSVMSHFVDEEKLLIPLCLTLDKSEQIKTGDLIHKRVKSEPMAKFGFCGMIDLAKNDKVVGKSINKSIPGLIRKLLPALWNKSEYKWFITALEVVQ
ncbi:hypothetical protein DFA_00206 [Cavenderia fasciculata]|uniref:Hemerythrin-like domain-containing protein n=1 Tax=Cavenderia fasciculata TaxID=261658 RepID=F4PXW8_CACFS|nr:uncharacterized protein DFA_00206 [Cavenderia fasciculata]EGG19628.1 hypothetical protein DFA_00206 [Cavenderia fasciculata]|eukprot:XP_004357922.1 hypothetical protein DFA_00206 [Cavenderia fasciculata]